MSRATFLIFEFLYLDVCNSIIYRAEDSGGLKDISYIMKGLNVWKNALINGHLPEFDVVGENVDDGKNLISSSVWPDKLLSDELCNVCMNLDLPFLTSRHPELIPSVLRGLLEVSINYSKRIIKHNIEIDEENATDSKVEDVNDPKYWEEKMYEDNLNWDSNNKIESNEGEQKS